MLMFLLNYSCTSDLIHIHSETRFSGFRFSGFKGLTDKISEQNFSIIILSRFNGFSGFSYVFDLPDIFLNFYMSYINKFISI